MGFSRDTFEQYRKEIRIMWRVLAVGAVAAGGFHIFSLPWISRMVSGPVAETAAESEATPIEIIVEEEVVQQTPDPEEEPEEENPEPAASAEQPSAPPLATSADPLPLSEVASADTVAVESAIATENGTIDGQGAVGESSAIGLVTGSGEPTEVGDRINLPAVSPPDISPPVNLKPQPPARLRTPVQEIALVGRRSPTSRWVSCDPCSLPPYPTAARRERIEGQPVINAIFDGNGRVTEAAIEVSSGNAAFDQAALEEARKNWRFRDPLGIGGQVSVDVVYAIDDSEQYEAARQAGEIRTVELPVGQQIQSITPAQPSSPAASSPAIRQDTGADTEADTGSSTEEAGEPSVEDASTENGSPPGDPDSEPAADPQEPANLEPADPALTAPAPENPKPASPEPVETEQRVPDPAAAESPAPSAPSEPPDTPPPAPDPSPVPVTVPPPAFISVPEPPAPSDPQPKRVIIKQQ